MYNIMNYLDKCKLSKYINPHTRNDIITTIIYTLIVYLIFDRDTMFFISSISKNNVFIIQILLFALVFFMMNQII